MKPSQVDLREVYSRTARVQPLFVEPSEECEREDPLIGPQGFMFDGMSCPTRLELAQQFYDSAEILVETIKRGDVYDYDIANPVLYLYRHSIELVLKAIIGGKIKHHKLDQLAKDFEQYIGQKYDEKVPRWIIRRLNEFADVDPGSTAFRYAEGLSGDFGGEVYVGLIHLQKSMKALYTALTGVATYQKS